MSEVNVCRVCLSNSNKMFRLKSNRYRRFYEKLVNSKIEDGLPDTFCYICYALLRKSTRFSNMAQQSQLILTRLRNSGIKINEATLSKLERSNHKYTITKAEFVSIDSENPLDGIYEENCLVEVKEEVPVTFINYIDETSNDKNDNIDDGNDIIDDASDNIDDGNDSVDDANDNIDDANDNIDDVNDKVDDGEDVNILTVQPCTVWIQEGVPIDIRKKNKQQKETIKGIEKNSIKCYPNKKREKKIKNVNKFGLKCYENKYLRKTTFETTTLEKTTPETTTIDLTIETTKETNNIKDIDNVNTEINIIEEHKVVTPTKTYTKKSSLPRNYISGKDKSKDTIAPSSDSNISKCDKPLKTVTNTQKILWEQVTSFLENATKKKQEKISETSSDKNTEQTSSCVKETKIPLDNQMVLPYIQEKPSPYRYVETEGSKGFYHCIRCNYKCYTSMRFAQHLKSCNTNYKLLMSEENDSIKPGFACKLCDFKTPSKLKYRRHMYRIHDYQVYWCKMCAFKCYQYKDYEKHMQSHKMNKQYICDICQYCVSNKQIMVRHLKSHGKNKTYSCQECDFTVHSRALLKEHAISIHNGLISCKKCDFKCPTQRELRFHDHEIHDNMPIQSCKLCEYKCVYVKNLKCHMRRSHEGYKCYKCDYKTKKRDELKSHLQAEHNESKLYACEFCDFKSNERHGVEQHSMIHTDEGYICDICNFKCNYKSNLVIHMFTHVQEKKLLCQYCGAKFKTNQRLKLHLLIHVGERKVTCSMCDFKCFKNSILKRHMRKHTGEKPYICELCGARFTRRANLRHHVTNQRCPKKT